MHNKIIIILLLSMTLLLMPEKSMAFLKNTLNVDEFYHLINEENKKNKKIAQINNIEISGFTLTDRHIENIHFSDTNWNNINAENKMFNNVVFEDCTLTNINLRNSRLINVVFKNCNLKNVVLNNSTIENLRFENSKLLSTDTNVKNSYRELIADKVIFDESELKNINFFDSKAEFYFNNSKLDDVTGMGLKSGSALYFNNVNAFDIDFSSSSLLTLEVKNSTIKNSKANGCDIDRLLFKDSQLDFPISDGIKFDTVISKNTGNVIISGTPIRKTHISDCPKNTNTIFVGGDTFESIVIENCNSSEIVFFESTGKYVSIDNTDVSWLDFSASNIEQLKLNNVNIRNKLYYDSTIVKELEATNISFGDNMKHRHKDANIEIKVDK